jgi:acyl-CoA thioester hydrolase
MRLTPQDIEITEDEILADLSYPAASPGAGGEWTRRVTVRWADADANGHMRNTAYSELANEARFAFLAERGFTARRLRGLGVAPVILTESLIYRREVLPGEEVTVSLATARLSPDASRATLEHQIRKADGATAARVELDTAWLSLETRKLIVPPTELAAVLRAAPRA